MPEWKSLLDASGEYGEFFLGARQGLRGGKFSAGCRVGFKIPDSHFDRIEHRLRHGDSPLGGLKDGRCVVDEKTTHG